MNIDNSDPVAGIAPVLSRRARAHTPDGRPSEDDVGDMAKMNGSPDLRHKKGNVGDLTRTAENFTPDIVLVDQIPGGSWIEALCVRENGLSLASRLDAPEIWLIDVNDHSFEPVLLHTFPDATGVTNMFNLPGLPDEYIVISCTCDVGTTEFHDFHLWHLEVNSAEVKNTPKVTKVLDLPTDGVFLAPVTLPGRKMMMGDSGNGTLVYIDLNTKEYKTLAADAEMMLPTTKEAVFGIARMRLTDRYLYFANASKGYLCRIPCDGIQAKPSQLPSITGPVEFLFDVTPHTDGFVMSADGKSAWFINYAEENLVRIEKNEMGMWTSKVEMENICNPTAMELAYLNGRPTLYIVCCGEYEIGWRTQDIKQAWKDMAEIEGKTTVSVTTEMV